MSQSIIQDSFFFFLGKLFKGSSLHFKDMIYRISNQFISFFRKMDGFILYKKLTL